jgi:hypothetical protein
MARHRSRLNSSPSGSGLFGPARSSTVMLVGADANLASRALANWKRCRPTRSAPIARSTPISRTVRPVRPTLRWREMDSNFRFRVRCKRGLTRKSPARLHAAVDSAAAVGGHQLRRKAKSRDLTLIGRGIGSNRLIPTTLWFMPVDCRRRRNMSGRGDHGDFDTGPIPRIKPHRRTRARGAASSRSRRFPANTCTAASSAACQSRRRRSLSM